MLAVAFDCALFPEATDFPPEMAPLLEGPLDVGTAVAEDAIFFAGRWKWFELGRSGVSRVKRLETATSADQAQRKRRKIMFCSREEIELLKCVLGCGVKWKREKSWDYVGTDGCSEVE